MKYIKLFESLTIPSVEFLDDVFIEYLELGKGGKSVQFREDGFYIVYNVKSITNKNWNDEMQDLYNRLVKFNFEYCKPGGDSDGFSGMFYIKCDGKGILEYLDSLFKNCKTYKRDVDHYKKEYREFVWKTSDNKKDLVVYNFSKDRWDISDDMKYDFARRFKIIKIEKMISWYLRNHFDIDNKINSK